jgi:NADPH:quinone reductase-like Zn-dependent oxidoreductase
VLALQKAPNVRGYWPAEIVSHPNRLARARRYVFEKLKSGQFKPKIAKTFPFEKVVEAYPYMESNEQIGKVVVTVSNEYGGGEGS